MSTSNGPGYGQGNYPQIEKFTIDLNSQPAYTISFSPNIYSSVKDKYALRCQNHEDLGLAVYGNSNYKSFCPEITISSDDPTDYTIKKVKFGKALGSNSQPFYSGDETRGLIEVTSKISGSWSFDYDNSCIVFTPTTPQTSIKFKATANNGEILRLGHIGIVRDAKKPAPKLKRQAATTYPMLVNDEFCFVGESVDVEFETTSGTTYVYTTTGANLTTSSTKLQNGKITVSGLNAGETKTINVAAIEDDKKDVGFIRTVVCRRVEFPTVEVESGYPGYDATGQSLSYLEEEGQIKIARPKGIETVYYTLDGFEPTDVSHRVLPADGIIKLPPAAVGQTTTLKLVAVCGSYYGEVTTIRCVRASVAAPAVKGYTTDFELEQSDEKWLIKSISPLLTDFASDGVIIGSNRLLVELTSPFASDAGSSDVALLETKISDKADGSGGTWRRITTDSRDPNCIVFDAEKNLNLSGDGFIGSGRNECWLHLRAVRTIAGSSETATSEPIALHIRKAKPARPAKPTVTEWTEKSDLNFIQATVSTRYLQPTQPASSLRLGSDYGSAEGQFIQFLLSTDPQPAQDSEWKSRDYEVRMTADGEICKDLLILSNRDGAANINDKLFPSGADGKRPAEIYLHLRAVTTPYETDYDFVASETTSLRLAHKRPSSPEIKLNNEADVRPNLTRFINSITAKLTPVNGYGQYLQYAFAEAEGNSWPGSDPAQWERADGSQNVTIESNGRLYARQYDPVYDQAGETVIMDFEKVTAAKIRIGEWPDVESNSLVQIDEPLKVMGCYMTRATPAGSVKTAYVYVVNSSGNPLKIVVSGEEASLRRRLQDLGYFSFGQTVDLMIPRGGVTGRLSKTVTDDDRGLWPELLVTSSTGESYLNYLRAAANGSLDRTDGYYTDQDYADKEGDKWTSKPRTAIDVRRDFAQHVELRSLEWLGAKNRMRTDDGMELTLYNRLDVSATGYEFDTDTK